MGKALNAGNKNQASRNKIKAGRNEIKAQTQQIQSPAQQKQNFHSLEFRRNQYFSDGYVEVTPVSPARRRRLARARGKSGEWKRV